MMLHMANIERNIIETDPRMGDRITFMEALL